VVPLMLESAVTVSSAPALTAAASPVAPKTIRLSRFWLLLLVVAALVGLRILRRRAQPAQEMSDR
jgi:hypothetical protein